MADDERVPGGGVGEPPAVTPAAPDKKPGEQLPHKVKKFVVEQNACDEKPSDVVKAVKEEFGIDISRQAVERYDPTKANGSRLSQSLADHYWDVRAKYEDVEEKRGIGSLSYRLRRLAVLERIAFVKGNTQEVRECLKQAAEDKGGKYTNRREMSGPNGGPITLSVADQRKELAAKMLKKFMDRGLPEPEARQKLIDLGVDERDIPAV